MTPDLPLDVKALADEVGLAFVHRLFPDSRTPAYLSCPDDRCSEACGAAIINAAKKKHVETEVVDLRPDAATRLDGVTARLPEINNRKPEDRRAWPTLFILEGFDALEGSENEAPIFPFRSRFQFDRQHLWLFVGRDWKRLHRMFGDPKLPLYRAATDITPAPWRLES